MPLSINKLEKLLDTKGLIPKKFFVIHGLCVYIEVLNISNADEFMLYIPSKYEINISNRESVYKVKYIDISENGNIISDYAGEPDNFDLEKQYNNLDIDLGVDIKHQDNMAEHLEENYKHPLSLKNITENDNKQLREVFRQLRRLKFCVQSIKYKICIIYKDYLCCIRRDDTFECFFVRNLQGTTENKLMVSLDLETLYEKIDSVTTDIKTVREGVYRVMDKNQNKHIRNLKKMLEQKNHLTTFSEIIQIKKLQYASNLAQLENLLEKIGYAEKKNIEKLLEINERYNKEASLKGLHMDIERTHQVAKYEAELSKINNVKQEIISSILIIKRKHENLTLKVDKIFFDNIVMIDAIIKNFVVLTEL